MRNFIIGALAFLVALLVVVNVHAHPTEWVELNKKTYVERIDHKDFKEFEKVNPALIATISSFLATHTKFEFILHSDIRPLWFKRQASMLGNSIMSFHHGGSAIDFRLLSYKGMGECEKLVVYKHSFRTFKRYLTKIGLIDKSGLGLYPKQNNPFFHFDLRGSKARWGRLGNDGDYVGIDVAEEWLIDKINELDCGYYIYKAEP